MNIVYLELYICGNVENHVKVLKDFQRSILRRKHSCHTLWKAFDISKKTPLYSNSSSNDIYISWVIASNWLKQESPAINPDWLKETNLLSVKKVISSLNEMHKKLATGSKELRL